MEPNTKPSINLPTPSPFSFPAPPTHPPIHPYTHTQTNKRRPDLGVDGLGEDAAAVVDVVDQLVERLALHLLRPQIRQRVHKVEHIAAQLDFLPAVRMVVVVVVESASSKIEPNHTIGSIHETQDPNPHPPATETSHPHNCEPNLDKDLLALLRRDLLERRQRLKVCRARRPKP